MIFIIGGRYQGRLDYARARFQLSPEDICTGALDFSRRCLAYIDRYALECARQGVEAADIFRQNPAAWRDKIIIGADISCGVVPADAALRAWREVNGRLNAYLAGEADEVWRLFCSLPQRLK